MATLSDYIAETRAFLRDESVSTPLYSQADIIRWINRGVRKRDLLCRALRVRCHFSMTTLQPVYPLQQIAATATVLTGPPLTGSHAVTLVDALSITVMPMGYGTQPRYPMGRWPYSKLAYLLSTTYPTYPVKYSLYGPGANGAIIVGPPPAQSYPAEWDFFCLNPDLSDANPTDLLPPPYTDCVPWFARWAAKVQAQRADEADAALRDAVRELKEAVIGARPIAVSDPWSVMLWPSF